MVIESKDGYHDASRYKKIALQRDLWTGGLGAVEAAELVLGDIVKVSGILLVCSLARVELFGKIK